MATAGGLPGGARREAAFAPPSAAPTSLPCALEAFGELSREFLRAGKCLRFRARGEIMVLPLVRDGDVLLCSSGPGQVVVRRLAKRL